MLQQVLEMIAFNFKTSLISKKLKHREIILLNFLQHSIQFISYTDLHSETSLCSKVLHTQGQYNLRYTAFPKSVAQQIKPDRVTEVILCLRTHYSRVLATCKSRSGRFIMCPVSAISRQGLETVFNNLFTMRQACLRS